MESKFELDFDAVLAQAKFELSEMLGRLLVANGQLVALQKHSAKQAEELAALRKPEQSNLPAQAVPASCASDQGLADR